MNIHLVHYRKIMSNDLYWLAFEEELHLAIRPIVFETSALNLNDVTLILWNYAKTTVQQFIEGYKPGFKLMYYIYIKHHLTVG